MRISDWSSDVCSSDLHQLPSSDLLISLCSLPTCHWAGTGIESQWFRAAVSCLARSQPTPHQTNMSPEQQIVTLACWVNSRGFHTELQQYEVCLQSTASCDASSRCWCGGEGCRTRRVLAVALPQPSSPSAHSRHQVDRTSVV